MIACNGTIAPEAQSDRQKDVCYQATFGIMVAAKVMRRFRALCILTQGPTAVLKIPHGRQVDSAFCFLGKPDPSHHQ